MSDMTVVERQIPGRDVYVPVDKPKREAYQSMTNKKTISRENLLRLKKLGVNYQIISEDEYDGEL